MYVLKTFSCVCLASPCVNFIHRDKRHAYRVTIIYMKDQTYVVMLEPMLLFLFIVLNFKF